MARLHVNIDHVATLRQVRGTAFPDPVTAAVLVEMAGGEGITVHLREDRRHIQDRDVRLLRETVTTFFNLEMASTDEMVGIAKEIKPDAVCLVPERRQELTTEGGLDVREGFQRISEVSAALEDNNICVSLFIDPDLTQIEAASRTGATFVEIHTGAYANAQRIEDSERELVKIREAARAARDLGLRVNAGHGLNYQNTGVVAQIHEVEELNIGHAIISRAVLVGLEAAVKEMKKIILGTG